MKLVFLDTETTHLDAEIGRLWEVALIVRDTSRPDLDDTEFWWQMRPDLTAADPMALQVSRYYERCQVAEFPIGVGVRLSTTPDAEQLDVTNAKDIAFQMARHLDGATIVANNPRHDRDFLLAFLRTHGQMFTASHRMIDIRSLLTGYVHGRLACHKGDVDAAFGMGTRPPRTRLARRVHQHAALGDRRRHPAGGDPAHGTRRRPLRAERLRRHHGGSRQVTEDFVFWGPDGYLENVTDPVDRVVIDGEHYVIREDAGPIRGFGGRRFDIQFFDGRTVTTRNLWHQGTVPAEWRHRYPDNAAFVQPQEAAR